jgi:hypothetical protein
MTVRCLSAEPLPLNARHPDSLGADVSGPRSVDRSAQLGLLKQPVVEAAAGTGGPSGVIVRRLFRSRSPRAPRPGNAPALSRSGSMPTEPTSSRSWRTGLGSGGDDQEDDEEGDGGERRRRHPLVSGLGRLRLPAGVMRRPDVAGSSSRSSVHLAYGREPCRPGFNEEAAGR